MSIEFPCPSCGARLKAPDKAAGRGLKCPDCKATVAVPLRMETHAPTTWQPADSPKPLRRAGEKSSKSSATKVLLIVLVVVGAVIVLGCVGLVGGVIVFRRAVNQVEAQRPTVRMTIPELLVAWKKNPVAFRNDHADKKLEVTGYLAKIDRNFNRQTYIVVAANAPAGDDHRNEEEAVFYFLGESGVDDLAKCPLGSRIIVDAGMPDRVSSDVIHLIARGVRPAEPQMNSSVPGQSKPDSNQPDVTKPPVPNADDVPEAKNLKTLQVQRPSGSFVIRGKCGLTTYFNYDFNNAENTHYSVELTQSSPRARVHCYVLRDSEDGKKLFQLLGKGEKQTLTLECEFGREISVAKLIRVVKWE
jgi:hypothetical protein